MKKYLKKLIEKLPKPDGISLSWPPSINFPFKKDKKRNNLQHFEELTMRAKWRKEFIGHNEVWICEEDNTYQIDLSAEWRDFSEDWTDGYPNKKAFFKPVLLKIDGVTIKEVHFIYCDEARIFVPLPRRVVHSDYKTYHYEWNRNSLDFKLAKIIGHYHIYESIEGIAQVSKIKIV